MSKSTDNEKLRHLRTVELLKKSWHIIEKGINNVIESRTRLCTFSKQAYHIILSLFNILSPSGVQMWLFTCLQTSGQKDVAAHFDNRHTSLVGTYGPSTPRQ